MRDEKKINQEAKMLFSFIYEPFMAAKIGADHLELVYANHKLRELLSCQNDQELANYLQSNFWQSLAKKVADQLKEKDSANLCKLLLTDQAGKKKLLNLTVKEAEVGEEKVQLFYLRPFSLQKDRVTGLLDLHSFKEVALSQIKELAKAGQQVCLISFDLVGMKEYNNKFGYQKGDDLLHFVGQTIKDCFGEFASTRAVEDRFYAFGSVEGLEEQLRKLADQIKTRREVRIGVRKFVYGQDDFTAALNQARIAGESLDNPNESGVVYYDDRMSRKFQMQEYLLSHLDEALEKGWIQVYYQPVVRTLSRKVCNLEALSRWIDPQYGFISPGVFIPVLEEANLSHKLDLYVVRKVTEMMNERFDKGQAIVPVSVNISRSDFTSIDPVAEVAKIVDSHHLGHDLLPIEITETAVMRSREEIVKAIDRFQKLGFKVWMDDFGSGYSSLNALKDFKFNEIKIDMNFMRNFNERSKKIVSKAISMAKSLGIHTLCEGVETKQQLDFLSDCGCERIQGFYYSKPLPYKELEPNLIFKKLPFENEEEARMYNRAGKIDVMVAQPLAIYFYDGTDYRSLFANKSLQDFFKQNKLGDDFVQSERFLKLAERAIYSHQKVSKTFVYGNHYYQISFKPVAEGRNNCLLLMMVDGMVSELEERELNLDTSLKNILPIYNRIYLLDYAQDEWKVLTSDLPGEKGGLTIHGIRDFSVDYGLRCIMHDDLSKWRNLLDYQALSDIFKQQDKNWFTVSLRTQTSVENYIWTDYTIIKVKENQIMLLVKIDTNAEENQREGLMKDILKGQQRGLDSSFGNAQSRVWQTLLDESNIKFFWKDTQRRFVGVSQAFLDFYGFKSASEIIGKTDDQIGWHVSNKPFRDDELMVLEEGRAIINAKTTMVFDGVIQPIHASKFPIFDNGKVVGLVGYFEMENLQREKKLPAKSQPLVDNMANVLNSNSLVPEIIKYDDAYKKNGQDYVACWIEISNFDQLKMANGQRFTSQLIDQCAKAIKNEMGTSSIIGRIKDASFVVISNLLGKQEILAESKDEVNELRNIHEAAGISCDLKPLFGLALGSEAENGIEAVNLALYRSQSEQKISFDSFDEYLDLPLPMIIYKPVFNARGDQVVDGILIFVNECYLELYGANKDELLGRRYREMLKGYPDWLATSGQAIKGRSVQGQCYDRGMRSWVNYYTKAATLPDCVVTVFTANHSDDRQLRRVASTSEEYFAVRSYLLDDHQYFNAIQKALKELGEVTRASHAALIEIDQTTMTVNYEWAKDKPFKADLQRVNLQLFEPFKKILDQEGVLRVKDLDEFMKDYPEIDQRLSFLDSYQLENLLIVPVRDEDNHDIAYLILTDYFDQGDLDPETMLWHLAPIFMKKLRDAVYRMDQNEQD